MNEHQGQGQEQPVTRGERILAAACLAGAFIIGVMAADVLFDSVISRWFTRSVVADQAETYLRDAAHAE